MQSNSTRNSGKINLSTAVSPPDINRTAVERFLKLLDPDATKFVFQTYDDRRPVRPAVTGILSGTLDECFDKLATRNKKGAAVAVTINETIDGGRKAEDVTRVRAVFVEDDVQRDAPRTDWALEPSAVVSSSPGKYHYYWFLDDNDFPLDSITPVLAGIAETYGTSKESTDPSRVLRLAGFLHCKGSPVQTVLVQESGVRYSSSEILETFPPSTTVKTRARRDEAGDEWDDLDFTMTEDNRRDLTAALRAIPCEERGVWVDVTMALRTCPDTAWAEDLWELWSDTNGGGNTANNGTGGNAWEAFEPTDTHWKAIFKLAAEHGWHNPLKKAKAKRPKHYLPEALLHPAGPWGELVEAIEDAAQYRRNPVAAMVSAFAVVSAMSGGAYTTKDLDSTSVALAAVGSTKTGKTQTSGGALRLVPEDALLMRHARMGGSDEAIQTTFINVAQSRPDVWYQIDEIGFLFQDMKRANKGGGGDRWQTILELLTLGHKPWSTRALVSTPAELIRAPHLVLCGSTTVEALKGGIDRSHIETGAVNRLLIFYVGQDITRKKKGDHSCNSEAVRRLEEIFERADAVPAGDRLSKPILVPVDPRVTEWMDEAEERELQAPNDRARHIEMAFKLGFIRAIYEDTPVTVDLVQWGYDVAEYSYRYVEYLFNVVLRSAIDPKIQAERDLIERLAEHGGKMRARDAYNIRSWKALPADVRNMLRSALEEEIVKTSSEGRRKFVELVE